jgi:hypothetical protein
MLGAAAGLGEVSLAVKFTERLQYLCLIAVVC